MHLTFVPSIETGIDAKDVLLAKNPHALINDVANIPLMTGVNELEGLIFYLSKANGQCLDGQMLRIVIYCISLSSRKPACHVLLERKFQYDTGRYEAAGAIPAPRAENQTILF